MRAIVVFRSQVGYKLYGPKSLIVVWATTIDSSVKSLRIVFDLSSILF